MFSPLAGNPVVVSPGVVEEGGEIAECTVAEASMHIADASCRRGAHAPPEAADGVVLQLVRRPLKEQAASRSDFITSCLYLSSLALYEATWSLAH